MSQQLDLANPTQLEPLTGALRIVGGARLPDAGPSVAALIPPPRVARGREGDRLFVLLDLTGPASPHLYRELREVVTQTVWATSGSITAALRQAVLAANRYLFQFNLHTAPSDRCYGGLACAVLCGDDLFAILAGPARVCVLHENRLECFSEGEDLPHLGMGLLTDMRLHHTFIAVGDTVLLASPALLREAGAAGLVRALPRANVEQVLAGLEQVGARVNFAALVARLALPEAPAGRETAPPPRRPKEEPSPAREAPQPAPPSKREPLAVRPQPRPRPQPTRRAGPSLGERVKRGTLTVGRRVAATGAWLVGGAGALFQRMLPGSERQGHRRVRPPRPIPKENPTVLMATAISILVLLAVVVIGTYYSRFGTEARFQSSFRRAETEAALAQAAGGVTEEARPHWEAVLGYVKEAARQHPGDPQVSTLQTQAQTALDRLDGVTRLTAIQLYDLAASTVPRQLVIHGQTIFVLDPAAGWVIRLTLSPTGDSVTEEALPIVRTGQRVSDEVVSDLVDFAWVAAGGERQTSGLAILEGGGALVGYDPAWESGGTPQVTRSLLGTPPNGMSRAVGSFEGRLYVLDPSAEQIWRYAPEGDTYPNPPDRYFANPPPRSLADTLDVAIDGNIYLLFADGAIQKFLQGELQPFQVRGVPGVISQTIALAVDPQVTGGAVYVAEWGDPTKPSGGRVIVLGPDGAFQKQFRADTAFDALEALAVDEAARRLYAISGRWLYVATLP